MPAEPCGESGWHLPHPAAGLVHRLLAERVRELSVSQTHGLRGSEGEEVPNEAHPLLTGAAVRLWGAATARL